LKPQSEAYVFELTAGDHVLKFKDPAGIAKKIGGGVVSGIGAASAGAVGLAAGMVGGKLGDMAAGVSGGASAGKRMGSNLSSKVFGQSGSIKGSFELSIRENETVRLVCTKDKNEGISVVSG
jgi:hypothetical protein